MQTKLEMQSANWKHRERAWTTSQNSAKCKMRPKWELGHFIFVKCISTKNHLWIATTLNLKALAIEVSRKLALKTLKHKNLSLKTYFKTLSTIWNPRP